MLKKKDKLILANLRDDARRSLTAISKQSGIPLTTVFDRHAMLEKSQAMSYVTLLNYPLLGYNVRVRIAIASNEPWDKHVEYLVTHKNINSVFRTSSPKGFIVEAIFKSMSELEAFLEQLDKMKLKQREVYHIIEPLAEEVFYTTKDFDVLGY